VFGAARGKRAIRNRRAICLTCQLELIHGFRNMNAAAEVFQIESERLENEAKP
jgi:hypothetical protein